MSSTSLERCRVFLANLEDEKRRHPNSDLASLLQGFIVVEAARVSNADAGELMPVALFFKTDRQRRDFMASIKRTKMDIEARKINP